ncbi:ankyrin repeat [Fusarium denticulatum]|uniref:Ankyrin repeat n=1 Tax=Fusarium denticulatum TaxID=48507 RepID=A0A8H5U946_9HYPO|nr:ankyrin repeat [Fusarium denticulatum]
MSSSNANKTISKRANACVSQLQDLLKDLLSSLNTEEAQFLDDERGRLRVWASNIGALQPEQSMASLDARLKDAPRQRESVIRGLQRLEDVLSRHHLFSLSTLIRRMRPKGRLPNLDGFTPCETSPDIKHVEDIFPKVRQSTWLAQRLGNAITKRRLIIQYRQSHRQKLSKATHEEDTIGILSKAQSTVATTYQEGSEETIANKAARFSILTSATSFVSSFGGDIGRRIPDLPDMVLDGVQLDYGEPIECPYCRTIQELADRNQWRKHVFSDLQPYVCTFKDCTADLFTTREEWFSHEINIHRQDWECILCNNANTVFSNADLLRNHFKLAHSKAVNVNQLDTILEACKRPTKQTDISGCILCDEWAPPAVESQNMKEFCRHLARHQQMLALEALPIAVEGLEVSASDLEGNENEDPEDALPGILTCSSCDTLWSIAGHGRECPACHTNAENLKSASLIPKIVADMISSDDRMYFIRGTVVWPELYSESIEVGRFDQVPSPSEDNDLQQEMNLPITPEEYNVLWVAASLFEFRTGTTPHDEAGYPYLTYAAGEIFDVLGEKGELWLAKNQDDPDDTIGWIWSKHFVRLSTT